jgi:putative transposase
MVDTLGLVWAVVVHPADVQDAVGARLLLPQLWQKVPRLAVVYADRVYRGSLSLPIRLMTGARLEIVTHARKQKGFRVLPKRWVVERTFAWLGKCRRLSKDYEALPESSVGWIRLAMIRLMLCRLAPTGNLNTL